MESFQFRGFVPNEALKLRAHYVLGRIAEASPNDARVSAVLAWDGERYHCSVEIGSANAQISICLPHRLAPLALDKAEALAIRKLAHWQENRFCLLRGRSRALAAEASA
jgi:hypothetical protein